MKQSSRAFQVRQIEIDFEAGLTARFPEFGDCLHASVHGCGRQFKAVAADMDMSSSDLSRRLANNPNDQVYFPARRLPELIAATGDLSPIYWLIERFVDAPEAKRRRAVAELSDLIPRLQRLLEQSGEDG